ncbi:MAG: phosphoesterase, partial [Planctomycetales bacterium]|nr:phosphoesterase [Planctomycetales bacterium]
LPGMRPQAIALSPDGELLAIAGKTHELVILGFDQQGQAAIRQHVPLPADAQTEPLGGSGNELAPDRSAQVSYTGLVFSADGKTIYLSNVNGSLKVFTVSAEHRVSGDYTIPLPPANAPRRAAEIPSGLDFSADQSKLYVCGNLSNRLLEIDRQTKQVIRTFDVGVAPYDVKIVGSKAFVSNWGGRRPQAGDVTGPAGRGTIVRVDPLRYIASEGSVSIIDLQSGQVIEELLTGLHASALAVSPDEKYVVCANAASDNLSIIDVVGNRVIETVSAKETPADLFGANPNALAFAEGEQLLVANGSHNAIGLVEFEPQSKGESKLQGLIPVGWFPGGLIYDHRRQQVCVVNIKGLPDQPKTDSGGAEGFNTHHYQGSLSVFSLPESTQQLPHLSQQAALNMRVPAIRQSLLPPRKNVPPKAIPERIGEPSLIKHVVYIIKENRTYDQVLGALEKGRGRADLCIFGREITPNQHKLVDEFLLLDNTYCAGILSADGHQWSTTSISTDYMEKSFAGFPRSYPDGMDLDDIDALAYSPAGFIWDKAVKHQKSIRNYGEFMMPTVRWRDPQRSGTPAYMDCYRTWRGENDDVIFASEPGIESIRDFSPTAYVGWEMSVPDQYRADFILEELAEFEQRGEYPQLVIICLPNDHTSGTRRGCPTPASCMADNDLAFGRIVSALSHSKFWPEMAIFAIEDDPQAGWDHVSGYRTTAYVASPYARRGQTISTFYNTPCMLRTIEQILGLPPMNIFDASATPMFECFTETPNFDPFDHVTNNVPLDQMNPEPQAVRDPVLRADALASAEMNFREVDRAPEDALNRILWRAMKGSVIAYPEWAITVVEDDDD